MVSISGGKKPGALKVLIYGQEGVGKTTFASKFPEAVFIDTEGGTRYLDVQRFDNIPKTYQEFKEMLNYIKVNRPCKTLVIDTVDWLESLMIQQLCMEKGWDSIENKDYGKGYVYLEEMFGKLLNELQELVDMGINVVCCCHSAVRTFTAPDELGSWDRYELKLQKKDCAKLKEWVDIMLFANFKDVVTQVDKQGKKFKASGGQYRVMYTTRTAAWDAKNRQGLEPELPFDFEQISHLFGPAPVPQPVPEPRPQVAVEEHMKEPEPVPQPEIVPISTQIDSRVQRLMEASMTTEDAIRKAVGMKGWFPESMPVADYPNDFVEQMLIGHWDRLLTFIHDNGCDLDF